MSNVVFTFNVIAPVFLVIALGALLRKIGVINNDFVKQSSSIVFFIGLPAMLFIKTAAVSTGLDQLGPSLILIITLTLVLCTAGWLVSPLFVVSQRSRGAFTQGIFRSNMAILGLPIVANMLGESAVAQTVIIIAVMMPLYNILAVVVLTASTAAPQSGLAKACIVPVVTNPLILAVLAGALAAWVRLPIPRLVTISFNYLGQMTLPLALIGIGATLGRTALAGLYKAPLAATIGKTVLLPAAAALGAILIGLKGEAVAIVVILTGTPAAVSSFIMARAMDADGDLAASIVFVSTLLSIVTLSVSIFLLKTFAFI